MCKVSFEEGRRSRLPKFFISPEDAPNGALLTLTGENAAHAKVLRLKCGDAVTVCDGRGTDYHCTVREVSAGQVLLSVQDSALSSSEPAIRCCVYMAYAKADKLEHVIQKATELGAAEIVAFPTARCVSRPDAKSLRGKLERWQKIAASAAAQSGRGCIPKVTALSSYEEALKHASGAQLRVIPYENEHSLSLRAAIGGCEFTSAAILTGSEGGFEPEEVALAQQYGFLSCTLGPRILRCETAPLCALTAILFAAGALD